MTSLPIRDAPVHTFKRTNPSGKGYDWVGQFYPYKVYPVFFHGSTEEEVLRNAEELRQEAIQKYEDNFIAREKTKARLKEYHKKKANKQ